MSNEKKETTNAAAIETPVLDAIAADAKEKIERLRAVAAEFPAEGEPRELTRAEMQLAASTPITFLEKAARFAEAAPEMGNPLSVDTNVLRRAIAVELAYGGVVDQCYTVARRARIVILREKLKAVKVARELYRLAKGYVTTDAGGGVKIHVQEMKNSLRRKARKATDEEPEESPTGEPTAETKAAKAQK